MSEHLVRNPPEPDLQRRAIVDQPRDVPGDLLGHSVCRIVHVLDHRTVDRDEPTNPLRGDATVPSRARHVGVDLRNHLACRERGGLRHVDRDAETARTVRVGRSDLHERDVERDPLVAEQLGHVRQRERQILHLAGVHEIADILTDVEDPVAVLRRGDAGCDPVGQEMNEG
jgi:hypothetical protein